MGNVTKGQRRPRVMGVIKNWNRDRRYGFIRCYEDGQSYFVHRSQLKNDNELIRGSVVEFEIREDEKELGKYFAANVLICEVPEEKRRR